MKKILLYAAGLAAVTLACNKNSNNYSVTDNTAGMIKTEQWTGTISGYAKGDTLFTGDTTHHEWPKGYSRTKADTSIAVAKINGFAVGMMGFTLAYRSTDVVNKTRKFDTVLTGSYDAIMIYYYERDSFTFVSHEVSGYNTPAAQYYQNNITLHSK